MNAVEFASMKEKDELLNASAGSNSTYKHTSIPRVTFCGDDAYLYEPINPLDDPDIGHYRKVMNREVFIQCYNKWILRHDI